MTKNKGFITIPSATAHKLFKLNEEGRDALLLYNFLQYTSLWQNEKFGINNRPKATREYCKKGLHWSTDRTRKANKILLDLGLIVKRITRDEKGHVSGHFVELPFVNHLTSDKVTWISNPPDLQNHTVDTEPTNTDTRDIINTDSKDILKSNTHSLLGHQLKHAPQTISNLSPIISDYFSPQEIEEIKTTMKVSNEDIENATQNAFEFYLSKGGLNKFLLKLWLQKPMNYLKSKKSSTIFKET